MKRIVLLLIFFSTPFLSANESDLCKFMPSIKKYVSMFPYYVKVNDVKKIFYIDSSLILAIIKQESRFNPKAESHAGARGLMQIMPRTALILGADPNNLFNADYNIKYGVMFLAALLSEHDGDLIKSLSGYNGGSHSTETKSVKGDFSGRIYNNQETINYVKQVITYFERFKNISCK